MLEPRRPVVHPRGKRRRNRMFDDGVDRGCDARRMSFEVAPAERMRSAGEPTGHPHLVMEVNVPGVLGLKLLGHAAATGSDGDRFNLNAQDVIAECDENTIGATATLARRLTAVREVAMSIVVGEVVRRESAPRQGVDERESDGVRAYGRELAVGIRGRTAEHELAAGSVSSPLRWRPCTIRGRWCSSPASGRDPGGCPMPRRRCAARGRRSASSATADALPRSPTRWHKSSTRRPTARSPASLLETPSDAEVPVLRLLAGDLSVREIGERLFLSQNTIRSHTRALYRKLGVHTHVDAVARATMLGLIEQTQSPM
jgi:DNA-binding CsgD family transcriptional regulator